MYLYIEECLKRKNKKNEGDKITYSSTAPKCLPSQKYKEENST